MRIRLHTRLAGPRGNCAPGAVLDVDAATAKALVSAGAAEALDAIETAVVGPDEDAAATTGKRRGRKPKHEVR